MGKVLRTELGWPLTGVAIAKVVCGVKRDSIESSQDERNGSWGKLRGKLLGSFVYL